MAEQTPGELLAGNIAAARARRRLQQADLAARMSELGYKWVRQTVGEVENGHRRVLAEELHGLAVALEIPVTVLVIPWITEGEPEVRLPSGLVLKFSSTMRASNIPREEPAFLWEGNSLRFGDAPVNEHNVIGEFDQ